MRLLALDQASKVTGYSIFIDGKLETFGKITANQEEIGDRLHYIRESVAKLIADYDIDYIAFEDIQLQKDSNGREIVNNVQTFKVLAEVFGVIYELAIALGIPNEAVLASTWKSTLQIKGKQRDEQKRNAQAYAQTTYGIKCTQDEADALCIGTHILVKSGLATKPKKATSVGDVGFDWS
jgi:Holliday junction resolvasome RuvABC endonuclease subunit